MKCSGEFVSTIAATIANEIRCAASRARPRKICLEKLLFRLQAARGDVNDFGDPGAANFPGNGSLQVDRETAYFVCGSLRKSRARSKR
jgi:hypothetical protein